MKTLFKITLVILAAMFLYTAMTDKSAPPTAVAVTATPVAVANATTPAALADATRTLNYIHANKVLDDNMQALRALDECMTPKAEYDPGYYAGDGLKSAAALLAACPREWSTYVDACVADDTPPLRHLRTKESCYNGELFNAQVILIKAGRLEKDRP